MVGEDGKPVLETDKNESCSWEQAVRQRWDRKKGEEKNTGTKEVEGGEGGLSDMDKHKKC